MINIIYINIILLCKSRNHLIKFSIYISPDYFYFNLRLVYIKYINK